MVIVNVAVPVPPTQFAVQAVFLPLQEEKDKTVESTRRKRPRFEFMQTPHFKLYAASGGQEAGESPNRILASGVRLGRFQSPPSAQLLKG